MAASIIVATIAISANLSAAQSLDPLGAPKGEYVVSTRSCADLQDGVGALELIEFDGGTIFLNKSSCKLAGVRRSGDVFQARCSERGSPVVTTPLRILRPSERALSINGTVYNHCQG